MNHWVVLGEYLDKETLTDIETVLCDNNINFDVRTPETHINTALGQANSLPFVIHVPREQYELAQSVIKGQIEEFSVDDYSIEELKEMVLNPEEWHSEFTEKAKSILETKGIEISQNEFDQNTKEKLNLVLQGEKPNMIIFSVMWLFALLGGYIGIIAGYFYWRGKTKAFDGNRYFMYHKKYRQLGYYMFIFGLASAILQTYVLFTY